MKSFGEKNNFRNYDFEISEGLFPEQSVYGEYPHTLPHQMRYNEKTKEIKCKVQINPNKRKESDKTNRS